MSPDLESLAHLVRRPRGEAAGALVLHHGRGADEKDLFPLLDMFDPEQRLWGVTPRGPLSLPPMGAHWYVVARVGFPDPPSFHPTFATLQAWLDAFLTEIDVPLSRTVLGGFSQGAVMASALTLGVGRPDPAGLLSLSGFIPQVDGFEPDFEGHSDVPVAIGHGTHDPVISVGFSRAARTTLEAAGFDVTYRESPMPHAIDPDFVAELVPWISKAVARGGA